MKGCATNIVWETHASHRKYKNSKCCSNIYFLSKNVNTYMFRLLRKSNTESWNRPLDYTLISCFKNAVSLEFDPDIELIISEWLNDLQLSLIYKLEVLQMGSNVYDVLWTTRNAITFNCGSNFIISILVGLKSAVDFPKFGPNGWVSLPIFFSNMIFSLTAPMFILKNNEVGKYDLFINRAQMKWNFPKSTNNIMK